MGNLSALIDELRNEDLQGLESLENMSDKGLNNYLRSVGLQNLPVNEARSLVRSMRPDAATVTVTDSFRAPVSAAIFDITITRNTNDINAALPLPIFGVLDRESNYAEIINQDLPAGTVLTSIANSPSGKGLRFTYTSGADVDTIDVECAQVPYVNILRASQTSKLKMQQNKIQISDVTKQTQFSQKVGIVTNTIFGKNTSDSYTPNQFKSDLQNQNDIRTITTITDLDSETSMVFLVVAEAGFSVTFTSYIQKFETNRAKGF